MPFDGLTIRALVYELNTELENARIDKIYQPEKDELFFSIRQMRAGNVRMVISANPRWSRIHLSTEKKDNPQQPTSFCMLLRKYLEGGKIKEIKQIDMERIVHIRIEALDDFKEWKEKLIICEFMGRHSNIILVNPETGIIIDAIKKFGSDKNSFREVFPGKEYVSPPNQNKLDPLTADFRDFCRLMWEKGQNISLAAAIFNTYTGISPYSAREICTTVGLDYIMPVEQCGEFEFSKVYNYIHELIRSIAQGKSHPIIQYCRNEPEEFAPYLLMSEIPGKIVQTYSSMNTACDAYYLQKLCLIRLESMKTNISRKIQEYLNKAYKKKFFQEGDLLKALENEKYKIWGELLTSYAYLYKKGDTEAVLDNFYSDEQIKLELDPRYTPIQNAQKYFKIYNKSRGAQKHLQYLMANNQQEIDYLESVMVSVNGAESITDIAEITEELEKGNYLKVHTKRGKQKEERSQPRKYISSDGFEIMVGRNNRQNDWLTLRESGRSDLWLHTKEIPGTHVIVSLPRTVKVIDDVPDNTLEEAASLAAFFSQASDSDKVPVDYTFRYNVKKPGGAKPGMVIYDNYWTIMVNPHSEVAQRVLNSRNINLSNPSI